MLKGGYLIISKDDANIYAKLQDALTNGKPVLFYENDTTCYYIDTIALSGDDIVLTKGGKTITIEADGDITENGDIQQTTENFDALMENIVDSAGNKRFIDFIGITNEKEGVEYLYNKASLSGLHLMFVLAGNIENSTILASNDISCEYELPQYIINKIYPVASTSIEFKVVNLLASDLTIQTINIRLTIDKPNKKVYITNASGLTLSANRSFRIQFDLLIDADQSE